jgi:hypothetical protein
MTIEALAGHESGNTVGHNEEVIRRLVPGKPFCARRTTGSISCGMAAPGDEIQPDWFRRGMTLGSGGLRPGFCCSVERVFQH